MLNGTSCSRICNCLSKDDRPVDIESPVTCCIVLSTVHMFIPSGHNFSSEFDFATNVEHVRTSTCIDDTVSGDNPSKRLIRYDWINQE